MQEYGWKEHWKHMIEDTTGWSAPPLMLISMAILICCLHHTTPHVVLMFQA